MAQCGEASYFSIVYNPGGGGRGARRIEFSEGGLQTFEAEARVQVEALATGEQDEVAAFDEAMASLRGKSLPARKTFLVQCVDLLCALASASRGGAASRPQRHQDGDAQAGARGKNSVAFARRPPLLVNNVFFGKRPSVSQ